jgi:hypothetical protein
MLTSNQRHTSMEPQESQVPKGSKIVHVKGAPMRSRFMQSYLWTRRRTQKSFSIPGRADWVDPSASDMTLDAKHLGDAKELKNRLTGMSFHKEIFSSLWQGVHVVAGDHCVYSNMLPFDHTMNMAVISANFIDIQASHPVSAVVSPLYVARQSTDKESYFSRTTSFIQKETGDFLFSLMDAGTIESQSIKAYGASAPGLLTAPAIRIDTFSFSHSDGPELKLRKEFVDKWTASTPEVKSEMLKFVSTWCAARAPSKEMWSLKRPLVNEEPEEPQEPAAEVPKIADGAPKSLEQAQTAWGAAVIIAGKKPFYEIAFFPNGRVAIVAKESGVVLCAEPLTLVKGRFLTGPAVAKAETEEGTTLLPWQGFTSMSDEMSFQHDIKGKSFPKKVCKTSEVFDWLEKNEKVRVTLAEHTVEKKGEIRTITPNVPVRYQIMALNVGRNEVASDQNMGYLLKVPEVEQSSMLKYVMRFKYVCKGNAMTPTRPAVFLKRPLRMEKGSFCPL